MNLARSGPRDSLKWVNDLDLIKFYCNNTFLGRLFSLESLEDPVIKAVERMDFEESEFLAVFTPRG